jgi:uncharacterized protein (TIGR00369 family)
MDRSLTITWDDPAPALAEGRKLAPVEHLRAIRDGRLPDPPFARLLGLKLTRVEDGEAEFELTPGEQHYNPIGAVHGGVAFSMLDSAMGCAVQTRCAAGKGYTTLELKVNLVRAIRADSGALRATAKVVHFGSRTATAEGRLEDRDGNLFAHGSSTCLILG